MKEFLKSLLYSIGILILIFALLFVTVRTVNRYKLKNAQKEAVSYCTNNKERIIAASEDVISGKINDGEYVDNHRVAYNKKYPDYVYYYVNGVGGASSESINIGFIYTRGNDYPFEYFFPHYAEEGLEYCEDGYVQYNEPDSDNYVRLLKISDNIYVSYQHW